MKVLACPYCGERAEEYLKVDGNTVHCLCCGVKFDHVQAEEIYEKLVTKLDQEKLESHLRAVKNLFNAITERFVNPQTILIYCAAVKNHDPENILANLYETLINHNNKLSAFLESIIRKVSDGEKIFITKQVIKNLQTKDITSINVFIDSLKDRNQKEELYTILEEEIEKLDQGTYNCFLPRDIFIAHSSKDAQIAVNLVERLEESGFTCFISSRNLKHGINASAEYLTSLKTAIENCAYFLILNTANARNASCDVFKVEIPIVNELDRHNAPHNYRNERPSKIPMQYKKRRINYQLDDYTIRDGQLIPLDAAIKEFFSGYECCSTIAKVESTLHDYNLHSQIPNDEPKPHKDSTNKTIKEKITSKVEDVRKSFNFDFKKFLPSRKNKEEKYAKRTMALGRKPFYLILAMLLLILIKPTEFYFAEIEMDTTIITVIVGCIIIFFGLMSSDKAGSLLSNIVFILSFVLFMILKANVVGMLILLFGPLIYLIARKKLMTTHGIASIWIILFITSIYIFHFVEFGEAILESGIISQIIQSAIATNIIAYLLLVRFALLINQKYRKKDFYLMLGILVVQFLISLLVIVGEIGEIDSNLPKILTVFLAGAFLLIKYVMIRKDKRGLV